MANNQTIYALSTAAGKSGVAVIRVSGDNAYDSYQLLTGKKLNKKRGLSFDILKDPKNGKAIDQALIIFFKNPKSFTGEDVIEYQLHGSQAIINKMLNTLSEIPNFRMAEPGEFTRRAFENGKIDLTEAEAIADLINAETEAQHLLAIDQLGGSISKLYNDWADRLTKILAHQEADIEFPEDEVPIGVSEVLKPKLLKLQNEISEHLNDDRRGERLRNGIYITIFGAPNAGKSSLINLLTKRDIAIVSDTAGTTRDIIEAHLDLGGYPVIIADTAGIRDLSDNKIESMGIEIAKKRASDSDLKIALFDSSEYPNFNQNTIDMLDENTIIAINKSDLSDNKNIQLAGKDSIDISVKTEEGIQELLNQLTSKISNLFKDNSKPVLTRQRHRDFLKNALDAIERSLETELPELSAEDIRHATANIGRITGKIDVEDLLDVVFRDFCIGK